MPSFHTRYMLRLLPGHITPLMSCHRPLLRRDTLILRRYADADMPIPLLRFTLAATCWPLYIAAD